MKTLIQVRCVGPAILSPTRRPRISSATRARQSDPKRSSVGVDVGELFQDSAPLGGPGASLWSNASQGRGRARVLVGFRFRNEVRLFSESSVLSFPRTMSVVPIAPLMARCVTRSTSGGDRPIANHASSYGNIGLVERLAPRLVRSSAYDRVIDSHSRRTPGGVPTSRRRLPETRSVGHCRPHCMICLRVMCK
jgi:hypothetical protein